MSLILVLKQQNDWLYFILLPGIDKLCVDYISYYIIRLTCFVSNVKIHKPWQNSNHKLNSKSHSRVSLETLKNIHTSFSKNLDDDDVKVKCFYVPNFLTQSRRLQMKIFLKMTENCFHPEIVVECCWVKSFLSKNLFDLFWTSKGNREHSFST